MRENMGVGCVYIIGDLDTFVMFENADHFIELVWNILRKVLIRGQLRVCRKHNVALVVQVSNRINAGAECHIHRLKVARYSGFCGPGSLGIEHSLSKGISPLG